MLLVLWLLPPELLLYSIPPTWLLLVLLLLTLAEYCLDVFCRWIGEVRGDTGFVPAAYLEHKPIDEGMVSAVAEARLWARPEPFHRFATSILRTIVV